MRTHRGCVFINSSGGGSAHSARLTNKYSGVRLVYTTPTATLLNISARLCQYSYAWMDGWMLKDNDVLQYYTVLHATVGSCLDAHSASKRLFLDKTSVCDTIKHIYQSSLLPIILYLNAVYLALHGSKLSRYHHVRKHMASNPLCPE